MSEVLNQIPEKIHYHIKALAKSSAFEDTQEAVERIAQAWLDKKVVFDDEIETMGMVKIDELELADEQGALAITYSGSLVNIEPVIEGQRRVSYTSIGLRTDVPESNSEEDSEIEDSYISVDNPVYFVKGPVKNTSQILEIAVFEEELDAVVQTQKLDAATRKLVEEFLDINSSIEDELESEVKEPTLVE
jgi:hypothetical protein